MSQDKVIVYTSGFASKRSDDDAIVLILKACQKRNPNLDFEVRNVQNIEADEKEKIKEEIKKKNDGALPKGGLGGQLFRGDKYLGDFDSLKEVNELGTDDLDKFLELA